MEAPGGSIRAQWRLREALMEVPGDSMEAPRGLSEAPGGSMEEACLLSKTEKKQTESRNHKKSENRNFANPKISNHEID